MPGENLTRIEAEERAALVTVHDYDVRLDVTTGPEVFRTETTVHFSAREGASTFIDAITAAWSLGGGIDYLLHVIARDIDGYQRLIDTLLQNRAGIARYFTYVVTKAVKTPGAPPFAELLDDPPA